MNNNQKATKRALLTSVMALVMCVVMLVGTTFAWFTDTASTAVNKIQAGNLDVKLSYLTKENVWQEVTDTTKLFDGEAFWEPGHTEVAYLKVENVGNLALKYQLSVNVANEVTGTSVLNNTIKLSEYIKMGVVDDQSTAFADRNAARTAVQDAGNIATHTKDGKIAAGGAAQYVAMVVYMPETIGNEANYVGETVPSIELGVKLYATQDTVENDSFNNQYDKDADYAVKVRTAEELKAALEKDDNVILTEDIRLPDDWTPAGNGTRSGASFTGDSYTGIFNGDGKTISNVKNSLFGVVTGTVKNVTIEAAINNRESDSVGAVARILKGGTISGVTVNGSVAGEQAVGGVVGRVLAEGTVSNCTNNATVESTSGSDAAGGIVGKAYYTVTGKEMNIIGCKNAGTINGKYAAGGIVGFSAANVKNCENSGAITMTGTNASAVGGIIGEQTNYGTISGNKNTKGITVNGSANVNVGGIIGWIRYQSSTSYANNMTIAVTNNENSGSISSGNGTGLGTGGIVGLAYNQARVTGNKNTAGTISGGTFAAGIVGGLQKDGGNLDITGLSVRFTVTGNTSTTTESNITGTCKDLFAYNNESVDPTFAQIDNNKNA